MFNKKAGVTDMIKKVDSDHFFHILEVYYIEILKLLN